MCLDLYNYPMTVGGISLEHSAADAAAATEWHTDAGSDVCRTAHGLNKARLCQRMGVLYT